MDVELFRLLLIIGILFLLGIYFWDRHKRINEEIILNRRTVDKSSKTGPLPTTPSEPDALSDWEDEDEFEDDVYTPSASASSGQHAGSQPRTTAEGFLGLLKRHHDEQPDEDYPRARVEPSLYRPAPAEPVRTRAPEEPLADLPELDPEILEEDRARLQQEIGADVRREPWLSNQELLEPETEPAEENTTVEPEAPVEAPYEPAFEAPFEPPFEHGEIAEAESDSDALERIDDRDEIEEIEEIDEPSPASEEGYGFADQQVGEDLPLRDTEADDLHPETEEEDALEPVAPPSHASIEPVAEDPVLPPLPRELPHLLVQVSLVSRGAFLEGAELLEAVAKLDLKPSSMQVFHRVEASSNEVVYSMASMVEPGTFPLRDMSDFATPGVSFFMQLPGPVDGPKAFEELIETCQRMAEMLNAELQDQNHNLLSLQSIEHSRSEVQEHARQVQLAIRRREKR